MDSLAEWMYIEKAASVISARIDELGKARSPMP